MITYAVEPWSKAWPEMEPLWNAHWEEVATNKDKIKLAVDFDMYRDFETTGRLHLVVARENGKVVGYHLSVVRTHPHYKTSLTAYTDVYFLSKECRKGFAGVRLFREVERTLKARGVEKMFTGTKKSLDMTRVFEYLGWTETERTFTKYIGG